MGTKIVIFLAFTSVTLIFNAVIIWYAYKAFLNISTITTKTLAEAQASESTKVLLETLKTASTHAVSLTNAAKSEMAKFDPVFARAQAKYEFKLAEIDAQLEKSVETVLQKTRSMEHAVVGPAHRFGATLSGVQEVIQYLSGELEPVRTADDASSTPKQ